MKCWSPPPPPSVVFQWWRWLPMSWSGNRADGYIGNRNEGGAMLLTGAIACIQNLKRKSDVVWLFAQVRVKRSNALG